MRVALALSLCALLSVSPVLAEPSANAATRSSAVATAANTCGWSAQMEEDEGGPTMVASSCESDTDIGPVFRLMCGGEINIRYNDPGMIMDAPEEGTLVLMLTSGGKSLTTDVRFEEMDAAFAAYVDTDSPIISLLKTGAEVDVALKGTDSPTRTVSLKGSTAAIDTLISACE